MKSVCMKCSLGSVAGFLIGAGCWGVADGHCGNLEGDQTCIEQGRGSYCDKCRTESNGCTDVMPSADCHFAGAQSTTSGLGETTVATVLVDTTAMTVPLDTTNMTSGEGASAEGTTVALSGESTSTGQPECVSDAECLDPAEPFCGTNGICLASCFGTADPDAACASLGAMTPLCFDETCVACEERLLVFEPTTGSCIPCTEHEQCTSGACDIFVGTCFDPETVIEVGDVWQHATVSEALGAVGEDRLGERRGVLVLHNVNPMPGNVDFDEVVTIDADEYDAIAFVAPPREIYTPIWTFTSGMGSPTLTVTGATIRAYLDRVRLMNDTNVANGQSIRCNGAHVDIRRSRIVENLGGGVVASGQCELVVQNTFIGVNPNESDADDGDALLITDANVVATVLYSTLGAGAHGAALRCTADATVNVRNSLLVSTSQDDEIVCASVTQMTNANEDVLGSMSTNWFDDYNYGDFHLTGIVPASIIVADWLPGDPTTDIDGEPRVVAEGQLGRAGADVP